MTTIRAATPADLAAMAAIYARARAFMRASGNPSQWGDSYPPLDLLAADVEAGRAFLVCDDSGPHGVFALFSGADPTYAAIDGAWPDDLPYVTVHRIAGDGTIHGVFAAAIAHVKARFDRIRMDTHEDNTPMRHLLEGHGFVHCGTIVVEDGTPRRAYQWTRPQATPGETRNPGQDRA